MSITGNRYMGNWASCMRDGCLNRTGIYWLFFIDSAFGELAEAGIFEFSVCIFQLNILHSAIDQDNTSPVPPQSLFSFHRIFEYIFNIAAEDKWDFVESLSLGFIYIIYLLSYIWMELSLNVRYLRSNAIQFKTVWQQNSSFLKLILREPANSNQLFTLYSLRYCRRVQPVIFLNCAPRWLWEEKPR